MDRRQKIYDLFKHLTTLNSAAILLSITLTERFLEPELKTLHHVGEAFCCFATSLGLSFITMIAEAFLVPETWRHEGVLHAAWSLCAAIAIVLFVRGAWVLAKMAMVSAHIQQAAG